ncbi:MAG: hypothetical protein MUF86_17525, partial [Akkermansiaceae bacterium]|nr:hypothetical protein [Akkermansiaceae bacterium]
MAMLAKRDVTSLKKLNESIEEEKKAIISDGDWKARHDRQIDTTTPQPAAGRAPGQGRQPAASQQATGSGVNSLKYAETLRRIAEIEVLKKA